MKTCTKCHELKALDDYPKDRTASDGVKQSCKACSAASVRAYRAANPERVEEVRRAYLERIKNANEAKRSANGKPVSRAEYLREWRARNPDKASAHNKNYRDRVAARLIR